MSTLNLHQILGMDPIEWVVQDLLPKKGVLVLGGPPKGGKSRLVLSSILTALKSDTFLGRPTSIRHGATMFNAEGGHQGIRMRSEMYRTDPVLKLCRVEVEDKCPILATPTGIEMAAVSKMIEDVAGRTLIVLDPLVRFHMCDENNNGQMTQVMAAIRHVVEESGSAALIVHHTAKLPAEMTMHDASKQGGAKLRGASAIFAEADNIITAYPLRHQGGLYLGFENRYSAPLEDMVMVSCQCNGKEGCGRFYPAIREGVQKARYGDPKEWLLDHPRSPELFAAAWQIRPPIAVQVFQEMQA